MDVSVYRVRTMSRVAQWKIENISSYAYMKSDPFKIGNWNWHISVEKNRMLFIKLHPEISNVTRDHPPIASFIIRLIYSTENRTVLVHPEVSDKQLKKNDDFIWTVDSSFTGKFIVEVEFTDLKTTISNDIDWHSGKNNIPRYSKDEKWWVVPLLLSGPYIAGSHVLPANLANYHPWEFKWPEKTKEITRMRKKYKENPQPNILAILRSLTDEIGVEEVETAKINDGEAEAARAKGKNKAVSRKDKSSGPSSKRQRLHPPSHSNSQSSENSEDENEIGTSSAKGSHPDTSAMALLSNVFTDSMQGFGDSNLSATCETIAKICDAPLLEDIESFRGVSRTITPSLLNALNALSGRASFVAASDLERRRNNLEKKNLQLNKRIRELEVGAASSREKDERIKQLEAELTSQQNRVSTLESANQQLYESEKRFQTRIGELETEKEQLAMDLSFRENKYSKLKQQFQTTVANFNNDVVRFRNQATEIVCNDHNIPLHSYPFLAEEVPENLPVSDVSDSEANEEEEESDAESDGTKESDEEEEPAKK